MHEESQLSLRNLICLNFKTFKIYSFRENQNDHPKFIIGKYQKDFKKNKNKKTTRFFYWVTKISNISFILK